MSPCRKAKQPLLFKKIPPGVGMRVGHIREGAAALVGADERHGGAWPGEQ